MDQPSMGTANGFHRRYHPTQGAPQAAHGNEYDAMLSMMNANRMGSHGMVEGQILDGVMNHHGKEQHIQNHMAQAYPYNIPNLAPSGDLRRSTMFEFASNGGMEGYQFDPSHGGPPSVAIHRPINIAQRRLDSHRARQRASVDSLALNTHFSGLGNAYNPIHSGSSYLQASPSPYDHHLSSSSEIDLGYEPNFLPQSIDMGMNFSSGSLDESPSGEVMPMHMYSQGTFAPSITTSPIHQMTSSSIRGYVQDPGGGEIEDRNGLPVAPEIVDSPMPDQSYDLQVQRPQPPIPSSEISPVNQVTRGLPEFAPTSVHQQRTNDMDIPPADIQNSFRTGDPMCSTPDQPSLPQYKNAYSSSGFDMLRVLTQVAARPNPQINIGAVDMSCAFVVCDCTKFDAPIVYCSEMFERLTGYSRHEILGRNCRFLQAPDGKIQAGVKRKYVDDQAVLRIKKKISQRKETQISIINYRKGGQPFMNLLTMIPISWDSDEIKYYVGFQVDLVEQPTSITNKNPDGSYTINYQRGLMPGYVFQTPDNNRQLNSELSQPIGRDEVSTVLSTIGTGESELSKRIWDKVLLENTDDVVHVLSLKGLFLYLSPSSRKVLEYNPSELVGSALSSVCHPSDIVPVTRELKDTSSGAEVDVVYRIRRKHSGYTWFESHGSLHTEQGKGRKCIILVGRTRPVYALARSDIDSVGGIGENELWAKMSTSGMYLFVSSNVRNLLDRQPSELVGTSAQASMRPEARTEFSRILEQARTGIRASFKHDVQNKRGQTVQARTTIYPGDAAEGEKPTFLVAQTRLLKMSRSLVALNRQGSGLSEAKVEQVTRAPGTPNSSGTQHGSPQSGGSITYVEGVVTQAGSGGLPLGVQDEALASQDNVFDELKTTRSTSWQFELRQMEKRNRLLAEELQSLLSNKKKRKRRNGAGQMQKDCANCHTRVTPEWRRGPSGNRDLCNSCGLRWAKENGRVSPRTPSVKSDKQLESPAKTPLQEKKVPSPPSLEKRPPTMVNVNSHNAKTARMEAASFQGYAGGIPAKIEEGEEPMDHIPPALAPTRYGGHG